MNHRLEGPSLSVSPGAAKDRPMAARHHPSHFGALTARIRRPCGEMPTGRRSPGPPVEETMLGDHDSIAVLAVTDLDRTRTFYEDVLGLTSPREAPEKVL